MRTHSPFQKTVVPPVKDLEKYREDVRYYRTQHDDNKDGLDKYAGPDLLDISGTLIKHCDFLEAKMDNKVFAEILLQSDRLTWLTGYRCKK